MIHKSDTNLWKEKRGRGGFLFKLINRLSMQKKASICYWVYISDNIITDNIITS